MPGPLSVELRKRVVDAYLAGEGTYDELAVRFSIGRATVSRLLRLYRETSSVEHRPMGGARRAPLVDDSDKALIKDLIDNNPECTLVELSRELEESRKMKVAPQRMSEIVRGMGYTRKRGSTADWLHSVQTS